MSIFRSKINSDIKNIWRYAVFYRPIKEENRLALGEGNTPETSVSGLAKELGFKELIFKREDLNPNGSHKDRLLAYQVSQAKENGEKILIISSSGNAAVSAAAYCRLAGIKLFVFVSPKTDKAKIKKIADFGAYVIISRYALTLADLAAKKFGIKSLRPSVGGNSHYGLKSIAFEIFEHCGAPEAIFIPTSSAGTLLAVAEAFNDLVELREIKKMPALYAVQTAKIHPIAENFDKSFIPEKESLARGIIAKNISEKKLKNILEIIKNSNGGGAAVSGAEIVTAHAFLKKNNIETGYESAAGFAGALKLKEELKNKKVAVLLTGKRSEAEAGSVKSDNVFKAENVDDSERIIKKFFKS